MCMKFTKLFTAGATVLIAGSTLAACGSNSNSSSSSAKKTIKKNEDQNEKVEKVF